VISQGCLPKAKCNQTMWTQLTDATDRMLVIPCCHSF
jgi:hypothetical protein